jgi:polysaccharide export outer membrane protein
MQLLLRPVNLERFKMSAIDLSCIWRARMIVRVGRPAVIPRFFLAVAILGSCLPVGASAEYLLSPGDVLEFSALGLREMRQTTAINLDGQASFPLLGEVRAAGMPLSELQQRIRELLPTKIFRRRAEDGRESQVLLSPDEITLTIAEYRPIYLDGDVAKPGALTYRAGMKVRQAIALAGGYDTMRFRGRDPFLESPDFRAEYYSLWTEFAKEQVRISRLKAEIADKTQFERQEFVEVPVANRVVSQIEDLEARQLTSRNGDHAKEMDHIRQAIRQQAHRVAVLRENTQKENEGAEADAKDLEELRQKYSKGLVPMLRMSDARRSMLYSASQALQTAASLAQAEREEQELKRNLERVDEQRRIKLLAELEEAGIRLESIRSRLQAIGDKLIYTGLVKSQLVRGNGGKPDIKIFRDANNVRQILRADEDEELMPGDVVEIALSQEELSSSFQTVEQSKAILQLPSSQ